MACPPMRTDDIERFVDIVVCRPFRVEFERLAFMNIRDETNEVARDQVAVIDDDDLRALGFVIDDQAEPRKA